MSSPPAHPDAGDPASPQDAGNPPAHPDAGDPASQPVFFPDEILGEIFLRLDSAAALARASAACTTFLRVVRFLRRNCSLYHQPVVGFLEVEGPTPFHPRPFYHAQPPLRSASPARTLAEAADFDCSFLPDPGFWRVHDSTGGRLLLCSDSSDDTNDLEEDLVVCDPLHRRYVRIPSVPVDLTAATGQWRSVTFDGWKVNGFVTTMHTSCRYHPKLSFYNSYKLFSEVLMLDTHKMEFSMVHIPLVRHSQQHAIVDAREGKLGFLTIRNGMLDLHCKAWQDNGISVEEWQHEKTIPIPLLTPGRYSISFCGAGNGYLLLRATPPDSPDSAELEQMPVIHYYFTLHVKTLLVERLCMLNEFISVALLYANFPSPLSLPSV